MSSVSSFLYRWLPPVACMCLIFFLSSRQRIAVSEEYFLNFAVFKFLHLVEYATLYFLLFRAYYLPKKKLSNFILLTPFVIGVLYAMSDELHQSFVPTREGTIRDVVIDTAGILIMYTLIKGHINTIKKYL